MTIKINVLIAKNSFLTKTVDAETRYKTQHTSHLRKTLKCLLVSTCFILLFNSTNLELAAILKITTIKKAGNVMSPLGVTYGKYATQVPDVVAYEYTSVLVLNKTPSLVDIINNIYLCTNVKSLAKIFPSWGGGYPGFAC